jgi:hypothetical protein
VIQEGSMSKTIENPVTGYRLVSDHVRLASPPWPIQSLGLALLRPVAHLLGYRPLTVAPVASTTQPDVA